MGPQVKCFGPGCNAWRLVSAEPDTRYCSACGRPLDVDTFQELIELDAQAATEISPIDAALREKFIKKYGRLWSEPGLFRSSIANPQ